MGKWIFLMICMGLIALAQDARSEMVSTLKGKVVRVTETSVDVRAGNKIVSLAKDPFQVDTAQSNLKVGDEVVVTYVKELREIRNVKSEKAGQVPPKQPPLKPQKDDRIFYNG